MVAISVFAPEVIRVLSITVCNNDSGWPASWLRRISRPVAKSISPAMVLAVMAAIASPLPHRAASSSSDSPRMMVASISASNNVFSLLSSVNRLISMAWCAAPCLNCDRDWAPAVASTACAEQPSSDNQLEIASVSAVQNSVMRCCASGAELVSKNMLSISVPTFLYLA